MQIPKSFYSYAKITLQGYTDVTKINAKIILQAQKLRNMGRNIEYSEKRPKF